MPSNKSIFLVDGENLVFRYQAMLSAGRIAKANGKHVQDAFVWNPMFTMFGGFDMLRVSYYTSVVGDDNKVDALCETIAKTEYEYHAGRGVSGQYSIVPHVYKKSAKSNKSRSVDINITIDAMRHSMNDSVGQIVLVSGDGDFVPLVKEVMRRGKQVSVVALSSGLSKSLTFVADEFVDADSFFFIP